MTPCDCPPGWEDHCVLLSCNRNMIDSLTAALLVLTRHGIPPDIQELLIYGNPDRGIRPGALAAVLAAQDARQCLPASRAS